MKEKIIKLVFKYSLLFSYGGMVYMCLELLFRGRTDPIMAFCGGLCFICIGGINNFIPWEMSFIKQCFIGGFLIVTPIEYIFGILFNQDYHIWNYCSTPLNFQGQICLPFTLLWCIISIIAIVADDYLRYYIFNEDKPRYTLK